MKRTLLLLALLSSGVSANAAPLPEIKTTLAQIPASAPMLIHVRGIEGTVDRLVVFLKKALPDHADEIGRFIRNFSEGTGGRDFVGLAKDGPHLAAFLEMPKEGAEGLPKMAIILATTDNKKFLDGFLKEAEKKGLKKEEGYQSTTMSDTGDPLFLIEREGSIVLSPSKDAIKELLRKGVGIDTKISNELADRLLTMDVGVYLSMDVLNKDYAEQIKETRKSAIDAIENGNPAADKAQLEMARNMVSGIFQGVEDSKGFLFGIELKPTGIGLHVQSEMRPGTASAKILAEAKSGKYEDLGKLPSGQMFYIASELNGTLLDALKGTLFGQADDPNSKEAKAIAAAVEALIKGKPSGIVQSSTAPVAGVAIWRAEDPRAMLAGQMELIRAMGEGGTLGNLALKDKPVVKADAQTYRNIKFTQASLNIDLEKATNQFGGAQELPEEFKKALVDGMKKLIGDKTEMFYGIDATQLIQVTAPNWATALKMLDAYFEGKDQLRLLQGYAQMRKDLPTESSLLVLIDLPTYVGAIIDLLKPVFENQIPIPPKYPAPAPAGTVGLVGFALAMNKDRAAADLVISAECVLVSYKRFVAPFFGVK